MTRTNIVVDARGLGLAHAGRGIGRVIVELLQAFARREARLAVAGPPVVRAHLGPTMQWLPAPARHWNFILTPGRMKADRLLRLAPTLPGPLDPRTVACLYDLMPLKEPFQHYTLKTRLRHPLAWPAMRHAFDLFPRAARVWTISKTTAHDAERMLRIPRERLFPVPLAAPAWAQPASVREHAAVRERHQLPERFVFWVLSGMNHNKNVDGMLRATAALAALAPDAPPLVVAGSFAQWSANEFAAEARRAGARYRSLGRVSDDDLRALLGAASCVAVPSRDEGYALPVAEALACGGRVVANDIAVLRELAHPLVTYADASDARAFASALLEVARTSMVSRGSAGRRTWDDVAGEVLTLLVT